MDHAAATRAVGRATRARSGAARRPGANAGGGRAARSPGRTSGPRSCGRSVRPRHPGASGIYAEALYPYYHFGWSELLSLTDDRYRYIKAPREELYDLERDPDEQANLAKERGQAATALRSALDALVAGRDIDAPTAVSDDDRQRLAALGCIGTQSSSSAGGRGTIRADPKTRRRSFAPTGRLLSSSARAVLARARGSCEILNDDPAMTDVWSQYAAALGRMGRYQEAFEAYGRVIKLQPDEPNGPLGASSMLLLLNRPDDARAHAELAIGSAPSQAHQALAHRRLAPARR